MSHTATAHGKGKHIISDCVNLNASHVKNEWRKKIVRFIRISGGGEGSIKNSVTDIRLSLKKYISAAVLPPPNLTYCYYRRSHRERVNVSIFQAYCRAYSTWTNSSTWCPSVRCWRTWLSASAYSYSGMQLIISVIDFCLFVFFTR